MPILSKWLFVIFLVYACTCFQIDAENSYIAFVPKYVRPGFEIAFTLSLLDVEIPVKVETVFSSLDGLFELKSTGVVFMPGTSQKIFLGTVPLGYNGNKVFRMSIVGTNSQTSQEVFSNLTDGFVFTSKALSILIQTDKAIYQPGQTINFRAVCLKPDDLRPCSGSLTYQLQDPYNNVVLLENNVLLSHGVAGGEFPLNKDSSLGEWKISFISQNSKETLPVTVDVYKLPKFKVEIDAPAVIYASLFAITLQVTASYTYGKPVEGYGSLRIRINGGHYDLRYGGIQEISRQTNLFRGSWQVVIPNDEFKKVWNGNYDTTLAVTATITEKFTEARFSDNQLVKAKRFNIKVESIFKPSTIKPGLSYKAYVKVSEQDGTPLTEAVRTKNNLIVEIAYSYRYPRPSGLVNTNDGSKSPTEIRVFPIPPDGVVAVNLQVRRDDFENVFFNPSTNSSDVESIWISNRALSPSNSYLQITARDSNVKPNQEASVIIQTTEVVAMLHILVVSRGIIQLNATLETSNGLPATQHTYSFTATHMMVPDVHILASYIRSDGEIVADYTDISVTLTLENQVTITSSREYDAGNPVVIKVTTSGARAFLGMRAIDQSVLLLKSGNDLTKERFVDDLKRFSRADDDEPPEIGPWYRYFVRPSGAKDATEVFSKAGIIVLSDAFLFQGPNSDNNFAGPREMFPGAVPMFSTVKKQDSGNTANVQQIKPITATARSYFPETWLWSSNISGKDGSFTFRTIAPDTITSWIISAFSVSDQHGLGIADTSKITVFRKFFVSLNLPLKVTRGEIIIVQAIVFNYFDTEEYVRLELGKSDQFELLIVGDDPIAAGPLRKFLVPAQGAFSVKFPLRVNSLGDVPITVTAQSETAGDAIRKSVYVRPEGVPQCYSGSIFVNRMSRDAQAFSNELEVRIPEGIVNGSAKIYLYVYGEILGSTMNNLGRLLRTPGGCGEQNMLSFAPDVFVTRYLYKAGALDDETREKAYKHFHDGYSIELKYKHSDGSYSAFGERDNSGSTWLTAFVAKCFIYARELRPELVESHIIDQALDFLVKQQNDDGSFREPGRVSHKSMQSGVNSPITMTAYVLITLSETDYPKSKRGVADAINRARDYLERNLGSVEKNAYALSLVTYALQVSESSQRSRALDLLAGLSTSVGGMTFWRLVVTSSSSYGYKWMPPYHRAPSNEIEMTSYALLTYASRNNMNSIAPIVKWITSKQNELGGYSSTQDTVIAIQALSEVAYLLSKREQNLSVSVSHEDASLFQEDFSIDESNSVVFNSMQVPPVNGQLSVTSTGIGIAIVQLSVCYNIPTQPYEDEPFKCKVEMYSRDVVTASVHICCSLKPGNTEDAGMFLVEIGLPNGFTADIDAEKIKNTEASKIELGDESLNYYFDELKPHMELCIKADLQRYAEVAAAKPSVMKVSEYYKPERALTRLFSADRLEDAGVCEICGEECVGCPSNSSRLAKCFELAFVQLTFLFLLTLEQ